MLQDSLKSGLDNINAARDKVTSTLRPQLNTAGVELKKVLRELGVESNEPQSLRDIVRQIRHHSPSLRKFSLRLDLATYDLRKKLWWNANMMSAYIADHAERTYELELKPKFSSYRSTAESRAKTLIDQLRDFRPVTKPADKESD
ncbi:hypothetical protein ACTXGQ_09345 [Marinobacter sp. 1Y8]